MTHTARVSVLRWADTNHQNTVRAWARRPKVRDSTWSGRVVSNVTLALVSGSFQSSRRYPNNQMFRLVEVSEFTCSESSYLPDTPTISLITWPTAFYQPLWLPETANRLPDAPYLPESAYLPGAPYLPESAYLPGAPYLPESAYLPGESPALFTWIRLSTWRSLFTWIRLFTWRSLFTWNRLFTWQWDWYASNKIVTSQIGTVNGTVSADLPSASSLFTWIGLRVLVISRQVIKDRSGK